MRRRGQEEEGENENSEVVNDIRGGGGGEGVRRISILFLAIRLELTNICGEE